MFALKCWILFSDTRFQNKASKHVKLEYLSNRNFKILNCRTSFIFIPHDKKWVLEGGSLQIGIFDFGAGVINYEVTDFEMLNYSLNGYSRPRIHQPKFETTQTLRMNSRMTYDTTRIYGSQPQILITDVYISTQPE